MCQNICVSKFGTLTVTKWNTIFKLVKVYSSGVIDEWFQQEMKTQFQLEQLEGLRSEHTPATHTTDSYWIPSQQNKTNSNLRI